MDKKFDGYILEQILKSRGVKFSKLQLSKDLGISYSTVHRFLEKKEFTKSELALLFLLYNIKPSVFGKSDSIFLTQVPALKATLPKSKIVQINSIVKKINDNQTEYKFEEYHGKVIDVLHGVNQNIRVFDYFEESYPLESFKKIQDSYDLYYSKIMELCEDKIQANKDFKYTRILQLPYQYSGVIRLGTSIDSVCQLAISIMNVEKFKHILSCFYRLGNNFRLRVLSSPARLYTYILVDEISLITEYFRYNKRKDAIPNILFIDTVDYNRPNNDEVARLIIDLKEEFDFFADKNNDLASKTIDKNLFKTCFHIIYEIQQNLVEDIEKIQELGTIKKIKEHFDRSSRVEGTTIRKADYDISREYALQQRDKEISIFNNLKEKREILLELEKEYEP